LSSPKDLFKIDIYINILKEIFPFQMHALNGIKTSKESIEEKFVTLVDLISRKLLRTHLSHIDCAKFVKFDEQ